jgi:hypothetical protein
MVSLVLHVSHLLADPGYISVQFLLRWVCLRQMLLFLTRPFHLPEPEEQVEADVLLDRDELLQLLWTSQFSAQQSLSPAESA